MAIGPVQLIVLGFPHPDFRGEILAELERLRACDTLKVIDSLVVLKDAGGVVTAEHLSNLTRTEAMELGSTIGALIGLGLEGEEGARKGAESGARAAAADGGVRLFTDADERAVLDDIPNGTAAVLLLVEHQWAVPLRNAVLRAGGLRIRDAFVSPLDLIEVGLVSAAEGRQLHDYETSAAASTT